MSKCLWHIIKEDIWVQQACIMMINIISHENVDKAIRRDLSKPNGKRKKYIDNTKILERMQSNWISHTLPVVMLNNYNQCGNSLALFIKLNTY